MYRIFKTALAALLTLASTAAFSQNISKETLDIVRRTNPQLAIEYDRLITKLDSLATPSYKDMELFNFDTPITQDILNVYLSLQDSAPQRELSSKKVIKAKVLDLDQDGVNEIAFKNRSYSACISSQCLVTIVKADLENEAWNVIYEDYVSELYIERLNPPEEVSAQKDETLIPEGGHLKILPKKINSSDEYIFEYKQKKDRYTLSDSNFSEAVNFLSLNDMDKESLIYSDVKTVLNRDFGERFLVIENSDPELNSVLVGAADLNKDEDLETFILFQNSVFCDTNSVCKMFVYDKLETQPSFSFEFAFDRLMIGKQRPNSLSDIVLYEDGTYNIYRWDNQKMRYNFNKTIEE